MLVGQFPLVLRVDSVSRILKYASWLISKGADTHRIVPGSTTTALHQFCFNIGCQIPSLYHFTHPYVGENEHRSILDDECHNFLLEIATREDVDECFCSCSIDGCRTLTTMLQSAFEHVVSEGYAWSKGHISAEARITQQFVELLLPEFQDSEGAARSTIRFLTFTEMGLTHTCCQAESFKDIKLLQARDKEDVEEIREEERDPLEELEELIAEFESKYDELGVPLTEFLRGYWKTRMEEVLNKNEPVAEDEVRRVWELGVVLDDDDDDDDDFDL